MRTFFLVVAIAAASALAACAGAPVTQATQAFCAGLPAARIAEDIAELKAARKLTPEEQMAKVMLRANSDARCAAAGFSVPASAPASAPTVTPAS